MNRPGPPGMAAAGRRLRGVNTRIRASFTRISWRDLLLTLVPVLLAVALIAWATARYVRPAPPAFITFTSGPEGSSWQRIAARYGQALARSGVAVRMQGSNGSLENLQRLADPAAAAEVGFVQVGTRLPAPAADAPPRTELVSLGTIARQPLYLIHRGAAPITRLAQLQGRRLVVGPEGSGTRALALELLKASKIEAGGATRFLDMDDEVLEGALARGEIDAVFLMGDSASPRLVRSLIVLPGVHVARLDQLEAYLRRFPHLARIVIPMGAYDFAANVPATDLELLGPAVEVVARADLHPAISDLLIETMREVHGGAGLLRRAREFPAPIEHELPISEAAQRYYASGKRWLFRTFPFWAASLADRFLVVLVPMVVVLIPALRFVPTLYAWRIRMRLYRIYGRLLELERDVRDHQPDERARLLERLDQIEQLAGNLRLPLSFADQFYVLREHISFVRRWLAALRAAGPEHPAAACACAPTILASSAS